MQIIIATDGGVSIDEIDITRDEISKVLRGNPQARAEFLNKFDTIRVRTELGLPTRGMTR